MKDEEMCPDLSFHSSNAGMQNETEEYYEIDDNGAPESDSMPTTDERTGDRGTGEQKAGGGRGGEEEREKVKTSTGESSLTTVDTLTADASQLSLIGQNKAKKCKKKSKKPKASGDAEGSRSNDAKSSGIDAASKQQSTGAAVIAAGQTLSKEKPTAATSSADAVSAAVGSSGISSNRGKSLSSFSFNVHMATLAILAVFGQMQGVSGRLTIPPSNVLAKSGSEVRLRCSTDLTDPVYWLRRLMHGASSSSSETQIFYYGDLGFSSSVNGRFKIDRSRGEGSYDVIISDVTAKDAGVYICRDDGGMGERKEMQLVVFDYFNCTMPMPPVGFLGQNDIADDEIRASCSLKYHGNQKPRFHWRWSDNSMVDSTEEVSESTTIVSRAMTLPRKELNGAKLTCTASISSALASASASASGLALASDGSNGQDFSSSSSSSSSSSVQWTSHQVTVLPASPQPGKVEQCKGSSLILVCNSECEYMESQLNDGLCQCVAVYRRSEDQRREFAFSVYSCAADSSSWNTLVLIIPFAIGAAMVMSAIPVIVVIIRKYKGKSKPEDKEKQPEPNESTKSSHNSINSTGSSDGSELPLIGEPTTCLTTGTGA